MKLFRNILLAAGAVFCLCSCMRPYEADESWVREQLESVNDTRSNIYGKMILSAGQVVKTVEGDPAVIFLKPSVTIPDIERLRKKTGPELDKDGFFRVTVGEDLSILSEIKEGTVLVMLTRCGVKPDENVLQEWRIHYPEQEASLWWRQLLK